MRDFIAGIGLFIIYLGWIQINGINMQNFLDGIKQNNPKMMPFTYYASNVIRKFK